jgi:hypothetical protein
LKPARSLERPPGNLEYVGEKLRRFALIEAADVTDQRDEVAAGHASGEIPPFAGAPVDEDGAAACGLVSEEKVVGVESAVGEGSSVREKIVVREENAIGEGSSVREERHKKRRSLLERFLVDPIEVDCAGARPLRRERRVVRQIGFGIHAGLLARRPLLANVRAICHTKLACPRLTSSRIGVVRR